MAPTHLWHKLSKRFFKVSYETPDDELYWGVVSDECGEFAVARENVDASVPYVNPDASYQPWVGGERTDH